MPEPNPDNSLTNIARDTATTTNVYRSVLADLSQQNSLKLVENMLAQRQELARSMLSSMSSVMDEISGRNSIAAHVRGISTVTSAATQMAELARVRESALRTIFEHQPVPQYSMTNILSFRESMQTAVAMESSLISSQSIAAQLRLERIAPANLGRLIDVTSAIRESLGHNLLSITAAYGNLINALVRQPETFGPAASTLSTYAPVEILAEATALESISEEEEDEVQLADDGVDVQSGVSQLLHRLDPRLVQMLTGARTALNGSNPDRARHVTASIRELFSQVLHKLAPTEAVRNWATDDQHFHDKRPTRRARLLYICREVSAGPLTDFVNSDVTAALSFVNALNAGTHVMQSSLTDRQLLAMIARMEALLLFILRLNDDLT